MTPTPKSQRIGIIVIAVVMVVGTLGSFAMLILANDNNINEQNRQMQEYQEMMEKQQQAAKELSDAYLPVMKQYENRPAEFEASSVGDTVTHVDLKDGDGAVIDSSTQFRMYYLGWNPKGVVFDSSFTDGNASLKSPLAHLGDGVWDFGGQTGGVIEGWTEGIKGMKIGGVRELTIPSDLGYGETGGGDAIPPNTPLKFVIMAIPAAEV